ncbi:unnamed protein product [Ilex paraguariensis]|uniref:Uncharacterized protein n=1 Tax=Ilex paraguariensis TaxID=185542 RepID=A0ABC8S2Y3_9AQUA
MRERQRESSSICIASAKDERSQIWVYLSKPDLLAREASSICIASAKDERSQIWVYLSEPDLFAFATEREREKLRGTEKERHREEEAYLA